MKANLSLLLLLSAAVAVPSVFFKPALDTAVRTGSNPSGHHEHHAKKVSTDKLDLTDCVKTLSTMTSSGTMVSWKLASKSGVKATLRLREDVTLCDPGIYLPFKSLVSASLPKYILLSRCPVEDLS